MVLVDSRVQGWARGDTFPLRMEQTLNILLWTRLVAVQTPETVVVVVSVSLLAAPSSGQPVAQRGAPGSLLLNLRAVEDVDRVGRQSKLQAVQVLVHDLFAVDERGTVHLETTRVK